MHNVQSNGQPDPTAPTADLNPDFWEERYQSGTPRWDLGQPAPPFVSLLQDDAAPPPGRMAVLGTGRGHDALLFAAQGFAVVGFDFAPSAVQDATAEATARGLSAQFVQADIFDLPAEFAHSFDYVLEHTCFCAITPAQRPAYVRAAHGLLRPQGQLIALFWAHNRPGGPPFGSTLSDIRQLFSSAFEIESLTPVTNSVASRDSEYLGRLRAKAGAD